MSEPKRPGHLGGEIQRDMYKTLDEVADALSSAAHEVSAQAREIQKDETVRRTVRSVGDALNSVANEVGRQVQELQNNESVQRAMRDVGEAVRTAGTAAAESVRGAMEAARTAQEEKARKRVRKLRKRIDYAKKAKGEWGNAIGTTALGAVLGILARQNIVYEGESVGGAILGILCAVFLCMGISTFVNAVRLRRVAAYQRVLGERSYCTVQELANMTERTQKFVRRDLRRLISEGKYEGVYLSPDAQHLFSNETAYRLYMAHESELAQQREQESARAAQAQPEPELEEAEAEPEAAEPTVLEECRMFLRELREQQRCITEAAMLSETQKIESETQNILLWLEKHPDGAGQIRRFASYYMPTTLKLLRTYNEVSPQAGSSTVAAEIQAEICKILGTVQTAFQNLQNNLLKDTALDVSAEISALETVLAQDGLTKDGLTFS